MPGAVRWAVLAAVGLVLAGALYLVSVRGEALLLDLSALGAHLLLLATTHAAPNLPRPPVPSLAGRGWGWGVSSKMRPGW